MIGVPMPPNAAGAVLPMSATPAAFSGSKPSAMSIPTVMATGVPKPVSASSSAPNENPIINAWMRRSSETAPTPRRSVWKWPVATVIV